MKNLILSFTFLLISIFALEAAEIDVHVSVNTEQLTQEAQIDVSTMATDLERYINNESFTKNDWEGPKIPVELSIFLSGGSNYRYNARMVVISKRTLDGPDAGSSIALILPENEWSFEYQRGANLSYNPLRFNEFVSVIDFYMLLAIGMDMDTYEDLGGTRYYEMAKQIVQNGASYGAAGFSTYTSPGKFTKWSLLTEMTDLRYEEFRRMIFSYYYDGLDLMTFDKEKGLKGLADVIRDLADYKKDRMTGPSVFMQMFFDTKSRELSQIFKEYSDKTIYDELIYLDPSNATLYREAKDSK